MEQSDGSIGLEIDKENGETNPAETPPRQTYCTKLKYVCKLLIINEILVEATGVELFRVLITRNLLIS
jgi:hypothetical protein